MAEAADKATNGKPIANHVVGIQVMGWIFFVLVASTGKG
jgi:hypothetical protein